MGFLGVQSSAIGEDLIRRIGDIELLDDLPLQAQWAYDGWPELVRTSAS
jgi:hypothetical protein